MSEGQKGGEFFTPTSIVKLIVEVIDRGVHCLLAVDWKISRLREVANSCSD
jgi:N-6 DNA Methylase